MKFPSVTKCLKKRPFETYNQRILDVLKQAFQFAKEKYEWLYTDQTNYSWFLPDDDILADVLYELAKYDLSVLNRDVLGAVYEDYLDTHDKKNIGQYYTPFPIVNLIWNRIGYRTSKDFYRIEIEKKKPKKVFDPATGSGGFLVEAARRIRSESHTRKTVKDMLDMKNAIVNGLYGSEISVFSYYITEVSLLIQLTPVIQRIITLEPRRREAEGKFTLSVVRQDSLNLHNPPARIDNAEKPEADEHTRYGLELLKPTGEKLRVYESIKDSSDFDYAVANPPYIGEDGHKELFRRTLALFPYWKEFFQGKMDYLYFFIILAIQKLRPGGRLGFITTSYWLTADGASKLRKYILSTTRIVEIISFQEMKLFEHAKGQHNTIFILEREDDPLKKVDNRPKLVEIRKQFEGSTVTKKIQTICDHIEKHVDQTRYSDDYIDVYASAITQSELAESPWYLFHKKDDESLLKDIEKSGVRLDSLADVHQGVVPGALSVDQTVLDALSQQTIAEHGIVPGMGVFVLTKRELEALSIPKEELSIIRPYYKNSNVHRYVVDRDGEGYLIYTNKQTKIKNFPTVLRHLEIFKPRLEMKRETKEGKLPWWSLHWPREEYIFEGKKIVCPYRAKVNTFAYDDGSFYGSTDLYFITERKDNVKLLDSSHVDLRYILGILNSNVIRLWTQYKTKPKGEIRELFHTALQGFPIRPIRFEKKGEAERHDKIVKYVQEVIDLKLGLSKHNSLSRPRLFEVAEDGTLPEFDEESVLQLLPTEEIRTIRTSEEFSIGPVPPNFQLRKVRDIESSALMNSQFKHQIVLESKDGQLLIIEGEKELLRLLSRLLDRMTGKSWDEIENLRIPVSVVAMKRMIGVSRAEILVTWEKIRKLQSLIDDEVDGLYGLSREIVDQAVSKFS